MVITILTVALQWMFLIQVAKEITSILGISVFLTKQTIERRRRKKEVSTIQQEDGNNEEQKDLEGETGLREPLLLNIKSTADHNQ